MFYFFRFKARVVDTTQHGEHNAVIFEVEGNGYYANTATFTTENNDSLKSGFSISEKRWGASTTKLANLPRKAAMQFQFNLAD